VTADNAVAALVDQPIAEGLGDRTAFATAERSVTYAELRALVDRAGRALRARGVEPEQRVAVLVRDGIELVAAFLGALKIGAVAVPINTRLSPRELRVLIDDCRPKRLLADADLGAAAASGLAGAPVGGIETVEDLVRGAASDPLAPEPRARPDRPRPPCTRIARSPRAGPTPGCSA
jgi:benzoate-CoA ligase